MLFILKKNFGNFYLPREYPFHHITSFTVKTMFCIFSCSFHIHKRNRLGFARQISFPQGLIWILEENTRESFILLQIYIFFTINLIICTKTFYRPYHIILAFFRILFAPMPEWAYCQVFFSCLHLLKSNILHPLCFSLHIESTTLAESHSKIFWHLEQNVEMSHLPQSLPPLQPSHVSNLRRTLLNTNSHEESQKPCLLVEMLIKNVALDFIKS